MIAYMHDHEMLCLGVVQIKVPVDALKALKALIKYYYFLPVVKVWDEDMHKYIN